MNQVVGKPAVPAQVDIEPLFRVVGSFVVNHMQRSATFVFPSRDEVSARSYAAQIAQDKKMSAYRVVRVERY